MLDTCDAMLLIVKDWLKWVKMKTWSHSGRCLVCKWLKVFLRNPDINGSASPNSQRARLTRNILDGSNVSVHMRVSSHFLSSHLAAASSFTQPSSLHPPLPPPLPYCGAFAFHVSPGDVPGTNFAWFGGKGGGGSGISPPRGHPRAFDKHVISYPNISKHGGFYTKHKHISRSIKDAKICRGSLET